MIKDLKIKINSIDSRGESQQSEVEVKDLKKLSIFVGAINGMQVDDPRVMTITATDTVAFSKELPERDWLEIAISPGFTALYSKVFDNIPPRNLKTAPVDIQHVVGMFCLMAKAISEGKTPLIKLPETYLHPAQVAKLTEALVFMTNGGEI